MSIVGNRAIRPEDQRFLTGRLRDVAEIPVTAPRVVRAIAAAQSVRS